MQQLNSKRKRERERKRKMFILIRILFINVLFSWIWFVFFVVFVVCAENEHKKKRIWRLFHCNHDELKYLTATQWKMLAKLAFCQCLQVNLCFTFTLFVSSHYIHYQNTAHFSQTNWYNIITNCYRYIQKIIKSERTICINSDLASSFAFIECLKAHQCKSNGSVW